MEDYLDQIAKGEKEYYELCKDCLTEIEKASGAVSRDAKEDIKIDENHTYMIGKHGPVIKCGGSVAALTPHEGNTFTFLSVKKDIDLNKLRNGEYTLEEIVEDTNLNRKLGSYKGEDLILKRGQFGIYVVWGENKKSVTEIPVKESDITLEDVVPFIENNTNPNMVREITTELSIRKGKFGDYIFYKTKKMTKPRFLKLNGFREDYRTCEMEVLTGWIKETWKVG